MIQRSPPSRWPGAPDLIEGFHGSVVRPVLRRVPCHVLTAIRSKAPTGPNMTARGDAPGNRQNSEPSPGRAKHGSTRRWLDPSMHPTDPCTRSVDPSTRSADPWVRWFDPWARALLHPFRAQDEPTTNLKPRALPGAVLLCPFGAQGSPGDPKVCSYSTPRADLRPATRSYLYLPGGGGLRPSPPATDDQAFSLLCRLETGTAMCRLLTSPTSMSSRLGTGPCI